MFVERLTEKQVLDFVDECYGYNFFREENYYYEIIYKEKKKRFYVTIKTSYGGDMTRDKFSKYDDFCLWDFGGDASSFSFRIKKKWIRYLYKLFGEEYKEAYLKYHKKIFN